MWFKKFMHYRSFRSYCHRKTFYFLSSLYQNNFLMEKITTTKKSFAGTVLLTALIAGTLDMIGAIINYTAAGGKKAYIEGASMIIAGVFFHYLIAFIFTLFFFWIFPKVKFLSANTILVAVI